VYPRGRAISKYHNPNLDPEYLARTSGVYYQPPYYAPNIVISPTPNPPAPETPTTDAPLAPMPYFAFSPLPGRVLGAPASDGGIEVVAFMGYGSLTDENGGMLLNERGTPLIVWTL